MASARRTTEREQARPKEDLPVREVPSWDYWDCVEEAVCAGKAEILVDPGEETHRKM